MQPGFTTYRTNSTPSKRASGVRRNQAAELRTPHNTNNSNELAQYNNMNTTQPSVSEDTPNCYTTQPSPRQHGPSGGASGLPAGVRCERFHTTSMKGMIRSVLRSVQCSRSRRYGMKTCIYTYSTAEARAARSPCTPHLRGHNEIQPPGGQEPRQTARGMPYRRCDG